MTGYGLKLSQRGTVDQLRAVWRIADGAFDHCWVMDHFATLGDAPQGDVFDAWTQLAAMAEATTRTRIGCMVTGNTYRHPGVLAKMAATVDHFSGGRLEFGFGAGWAENEHTMLGLRYGTVRERADRFDEACQVVRALWTEPVASFTGTHYTLTDAVAYPKPVQRPHPPIWIGGQGRKRTLRTAARFADVWDANGAAPDQLPELTDVLHRHCAAVDRDPADIRRSIQLRVTDDTDTLLHQVDAYTTAGITEVILIVAGDDPVAAAENVATLLPRLRTIG